MLVLGSMLISGRLHVSYELHAHPRRRRHLLDRLPIVYEPNLPRHRERLRGELQRCQTLRSRGPREADAVAATEARVLDGASRPVGREGRKDEHRVDVLIRGYIWHLDQTVLQREVV